MLDDGISQTIVTLDNSAGDSATGLGVVLSVTNIGVWNVVVTGSATKPALGTDTSPMMDISLQISSTGSGKLTVSYSDINYGGKGKSATGLMTEQETGSIIYGAATVDFKVYGDGGNVLFGKSQLLDDAGPQSWPPIIAAYPGSLALNVPFSLTEVLVVNAVGPTHLNVDASFNLTLDFGPVQGCRVTGGSNHETNNYQSLCITSPPPDFVSHGGQVGASLSDDTAFHLNDPCIGGSWEHNRHLVGSGPVGSLHASGGGPNHNDFDSLLCACLPCPQSASIGTVGTLCNPGNRICGPEPMKAPANKICFSGVGEWTYTSGPRTVPAVFRVDIEDRGEGNSAANPLPPDRYRIRIWLLDPNCGRSSDPTTMDNRKIRFGASADPVKIAMLATTEDLKDPTINPPDIDDGGDMTQGNHQIHFSTGAKCK
jgi:hypothetical protein